MGENLTDEEIDHIFSKADLDEDGFVTSDDFYNIMTHKVYWDQWFAPLETYSSSLQNIIKSQLKIVVLLETAQKGMMTKLIYAGPNRWLFLKSLRNKTNSFPISQSLEPYFLFDLNRLNNTIFLISLGLVILKGF